MYHFLHLFVYIAKALSLCLSLKVHDTYARNTSTNMAPTKSDQNGSNHPAPRRQDQTDQGSTPWIKYIEQDGQPMEQEVFMAIVRPGNSTITISDKMKGEFKKGARLSQCQPLPDDNDNDFTNEPLLRPFDPESATVYDWAKPEAWIQEKGDKGEDYRHVNLSTINIKQDENCGVIELQRLSDVRDQRTP
jgi:hypothetical protein